MQQGTHLHVRSFCFLFVSRAKKWSCLFLGSKTRNYYRKNWRRSFQMLKVYKWSGWYYFTQYLNFYNLIRGPNNFLADMSVVNSYRLLSTSCLKWTLKSLTFLYLKQCFWPKLSFWIIPRLTNNSTSQLIRPIMFVKFLRVHRILVSDANGENA